VSRGATSREPARRSGEIVEANITIRRDEKAKRNPLADDHTNVSRSALEWCRGEVCMRRRPSTFGEGSVKMRARGTCRQPTCHICGASYHVSRRADASIGVSLCCKSVKVCVQSDRLSGIRLRSNTPYSAFLRMLPLLQAHWR
jgi:hypothetical protein